MTSRGAGILALIVIAIDLVLFYMLALGEERWREQVDQRLEQLEAIHAQEH